MFILRVQTWHLNLIRDEIRKSFNIHDDIIVLGHVGRYVEQKNHKFLIDVLKELRQKGINCYLLLLGEGYLKEEVFTYAEANHLKPYIIDAGVQKDSYRFYQAFDFFLLPSFHEGLPVVGIEAQASGLPCCFSDTIDSEVKLLDSTVMLSIKGVSEWVNYIVQCKLIRKDTSDIVESWKRKKIS